MRGKQPGRGRKAKLKEEGGNPGRTLGKKRKKSRKKCFQ